MASQFQNMFQLIYVINGILQSIYVGLHTDCNNMHSINYTKFVSGTFTSLINENVRLKQHEENTSMHTPFTTKP